MEMKLYQQLLCLRMVWYSRIRTSGLFCHILSVLLYFCDNWEKVVFSDLHAITAKRSGKGSIPMLLLNKMKLKFTRRRNCKNKKFQIVKKKFWPVFIQKIYIKNDTRDQIKNTTLLSLFQNTSIQFQSLN